MRNSLAFARPAAPRHRQRIWKVIDRLTHEMLLIINRSPQIGDTVLVSHKGILKIGRKEANGVRLRSNGEVVTGRALVITRQISKG
jgi:hypothetical protein